MGVSCFNGEGGGGVSQMGGFILSGGECPMGGASVLVGGWG